MKLKTQWLAAATIATLNISVAMAQPAQSGLVNVDVSNVANNIAKNINVDVSQIPVTVQVPVGVAATVCGVAANVLTQRSGSGPTSCQAKSTSTALDQVVQNQIKGTGQR